MQYLSSLGVTYPGGCDPDHPLTPEAMELVNQAAAIFDEANNLKMDTVGLDSGEQKPIFEKVHTAYNRTYTRTILVKPL